ncbi:MAG TPA: signal peptidase II [Candidatus Limnocylindria bacterium]|nr:signal peptidase II [Candidatus Limnocylindria bacterium]
MRPGRIAFIAGVGALVFALDRLTKQAVVDAVPLGSAVDAAGPYVRFIHVRNTGMAFGLFQDRSTILAVLSLFAVLAILYYYRQIASRSPLVAATLGMQLGGAFGNLVDRVAQGYVVDWIDVGVPGGPRFWAFNVADASITTGIVLVTALLLLEERRTTARA